MNTFIYIITENSIPFYVGKSNNPKTRYSCHRKNFGQNIIIEIIDEISILEWRFWEEFYIELFKSWGFKLKNKNSGGGGCDKKCQKFQNKKLVKKLKVNYILQLL